MPRLPCFVRMFLLVTIETIEAIEAIETIEAMEASNVKQQNSYLATGS